jgi:hypothetical protein
MNKPSLTDFLTPEAPAPKADKPKSDMMTVSYRVKPDRWARLVAYRTAERTSLQAVIDDALGKYFEARGLPF